MLVGLKGWANHQLRMREAPGGDSEHLAEAVQQLRDEVGVIRADVGELYERVEFAERMLTEARARNGIGPADSP